MPQVKIIAKNFMDMVASMPAMKLDKLYRNPFICEAILRSMSPLAKKYVLQLLFVDVAVPAKSFEEWLLPDGVSKHKVAIDRLVQLRVFIEVLDRKREVSYKLNSTFQANLQSYLIHGGVLPREPMPSNVTLRLPSLEELEVFAMEQWECFLLRLINSAQAEGVTNFSSSMMKIFQRGLLTQRDKEEPRLTESGFQFLLMDTNAQLWYIIREYISNSEMFMFKGSVYASQITYYDHLSHPIFQDMSLEERGVDAADLISFFLELSFHVTGQAYNVNTLSEIQRITVKELADLGLVKLQQGMHDSWFIPTKLATNLSLSLTDSSSRKQGFVVVETNFRMYAYSTSKLHCEILRLFSRIEYRLPNLIVGAITKESLDNAFENGITSEQVFHRVLSEKLHQFKLVVTHNFISSAECTSTGCRKNTMCTENVTDQIRLWESDLNRVEMTPAHLYDEFPSRDVFEAACDFAREWGGLLWEDSKKMWLLVKAEVHMQMREHLRRQK